MEMRACFFFVFLLLLTGCGEGREGKMDELSSALPVLYFPDAANADCFEDKRARLYDLCADQVELFQSALSRAKTEDKVLLVSFGAEWCIWCHVFKKYIDGEAGSFTYTYGEEGDPEKWTDTMRERAEADMTRNALALNQYVSENFVVAHIDYEFAPRGTDVLYMTEAIDRYDEWLPFIFTVDANGKFAEALNSSEVEVRRDFVSYFRGYDRPALQAKLAKMRDVALSMDGN